ncbi:3beta-hydroxysteroid-dehydrogenase/decarboxylase isoform 1 [Raphanus sativus]|nr:3beta-hydroxysteroid-dehydrogenase/decarboxylase isoform 1 [Raphanus sativus]
MVTEVTETERWCVVTGGRGFAARHLVEMLVRYQMFHVRIADLSPALQLDAHEETGLLGEAMRSGRVQYVSADLRNKAQCETAFEGAQVVFHMAAPDSSINSYQLHYSVNVQGTSNVIDACVEVGVKRLVYTSSPSVVFDGVNSVLNANETVPYPSKHNDSYSATKAEGEALILKANGRDGLLTCSIRPSSIFGPGDRLMVPSLVAAARAGKSKVGFSLWVMEVTSMIFTYVENVVHAHVCAERSLASGGEVSAKAAGQAYFITNMEPIKFWEFMSLLLEGLGYERPSIKIPAVVMMPIAHLVELAYRLLGPHGMKVPQLTPSRVRFISCSRTFDSSKAKDLLGYAPVVPLQEGIKRPIDSFSHLAQNQPQKEFADTVQWKKRTLIAIVILITLYINFVATTGYCALPIAISLSIRILTGNEEVVGVIILEDVIQELLQDKSQHAGVTDILINIYTSFSV